MNALERIGNCGIVPVLVIDEIENAVPAAKAISDGGIDVIEVTLRTCAGLDAMRAIASNCPELCVGAGTVLTIEQGKAAVAAGARFIVSPGFDRPLVEWCISQGIAVTPGCVTPTEITQALSLGLNILKFFPANIYGGLCAMKALTAPFTDVKFIPTGGVSEKNLGEFISAPYVHAVGGSWLCQRADIAAGNFDKLTALSKAARRITLGYEMFHVGINCPDAASAKQLCELFDAAFEFGVKEGNSSNFVSPGIEVLKSEGRGAKGHMAVRTADIARAIADLERKGFMICSDSTAYRDGRMIAAYLERDFGGFAVHLLQK